MTDTKEIASLKEEIATLKADCRPQRGSCRAQAAARRRSNNEAANRRAGAADGEVDGTRRPNRCARTGVASPVDEQTILLAARANERARQVTPPVSFGSTTPYDAQPDRITGKRRELLGK